MATSPCLRRARAGLVKVLAGLLIELDFRDKDPLCLFGNIQDFLLVVVLTGTEYQHLPSLDRGTG